MSTRKNQIETGSVNMVRSALEHPAAKLAVVGSIGFAALTGCTQENAGATQVTHSATTEAKPKATSTPEAPAITQLSVEVKDTTPAAELPQKFFGDGLTNWEMGGANAQSVKDYELSNLGADAWASQRADPIDKANEAGLFTQNALTNNPSVEHFVQGVEHDHHNNLLYYVITAHDPKVYNYYSTVSDVKIKSQTASTVEETFVITDYNNVSADDKIGSKYDPGLIALNDTGVLVDVKFVKDSGAYKIDSLEGLESIVPTPAP